MIHMISFDLETTHFSALMKVKGKKIAFPWIRLEELFTILFVSHLDFFDPLFRYSSFTLWYRAETKSM